MKYQNAKVLRLWLMAVAGLALIATGTGVTPCFSQVEAQEQKETAMEIHKVAEEAKARALLNESKFLTEKAFSALNRGDEDLAMDLALSALPKDSTDPERPYYPEAAAVLSRILAEDSMLVYDAYINKQWEDKDLLREEPYQSYTTSDGRRLILYHAPGPLLFDLDTAQKIELEGFPSKHAAEFWFSGGHSVGHELLSPNQEYLAASTKIDGDWVTFVWATNDGSLVLKCDGVGVRFLGAGLIAVSKDTSGSGGSTHKLSTGEVMSHYKGALSSYDEIHKRFITTINEGEGIFNSDYKTLVFSLEGEELFSADGVADYYDPHRSRLYVGKFPQTTVWDLNDFSHQKTISGSIRYVHEPSNKLILSNNKRHGFNQDLTLWDIDALSPVANLRGRIITDSALNEKNPYAFEQLRMLDDRAFGRYESGGKVKVFSNITGDEDAEPFVVTVDKNKSINTYRYSLKSGELIAQSRGELLGTMPDGRLVTFVIKDLEHDDDTDEISFTNQIFTENRNTSLLDLETGDHGLDLPQMPIEPSNFLSFGGWQFFNLENLITPEDDHEYYSTDIGGSWIEGSSQLINSEGLISQFRSTDGQFEFIASLRGFGDFYGKSVVGKSIAGGNYLVSVDDDTRVRIWDISERNRSEKLIDVSKYEFYDDIDGVVKIYSWGQDYADKLKEEASKHLATIKGFGFDPEKVQRNLYQRFKFLSLDSQKLPKEVDILKLVARDGSEIFVPREELNEEGPYGAIFGKDFISFNGIWDRETGYFLGATGGGFGPYSSRGHILFNDQETYVLSLLEKPGGGSYHLLISRLPEKKETAIEKAKARSLMRNDTL